MHDTYWMEGWLVVGWVDEEVFSEFVRESEGVVGKGDGV